MQQFRMKGVLIPSTLECLLYFLATIHFSNLFRYEIKVLWHSHKPSQNCSLDCFCQGRLQKNMWLTCFEHIAMIFTTKLNIWFLDTKLSSWHRVRHTWPNKHFRPPNWDSCTQFNSQIGPWKSLTAELCQGIARESMGQHVKNACSELYSQLAGVENHILSHSLVFSVGEAWGSW